MEAVIKFVFIGIIGLLLTAVSIYSLICPGKLFAKDISKKMIVISGIEGILFLFIGIIGILYLQTGFYIQWNISFFSMAFFALGIIYFVAGLQQRDENKEYVINDHDQKVQATVDHIAKDTFFRHNYGKWVHLVVIYKGYDRDAKECNYRLVLEKLNNKNQYPIGSCYEVYFSRDRKIIYDLKDVQVKKSVERRYFLISILVILLGICFL